MGQYWKAVNLDKREFIHPHKLACGLKLCEQLGSYPGTGAALVILCAAMPEMRGGGDLDLGIESEEYGAIAARAIGRWAGDRIAIVGDYAELDDLSPEHEVDLVYNLCKGPDGIAKAAAHWERCEWTDDPEQRALYAEKARRLREAAPYTDISDDVCAVIEHELQGKFTGTGWRDFKYNDE